MLITCRIIKQLKSLFLFLFPWISKTTTFQVPSILGLLSHVQIRNEWMLLYLGDSANPSVVVLGSQGFPEYKKEKKCVWSVWLDHSGLICMDTFW